MLTIRFSRIGRKNKAQYKIVLQEHTAAPSGRHAEVLGSYDPHLKKAIIKEDRVKYWVKKGAQLSDTVYNLLVSKGVISGEKRKVKVPAKKAEKVSLETGSAVKAIAKEENKAMGEAKVEELKKEKIKPEEEKKEAPKKENK